MDLFPSEMSSEVTVGIHLEERLTRHTFIDIITDKKVYKEDSNQKDFCDLLVDVV